MTPKSLDNQNKNTTHYDRKNTAYNKSQVYAVRQADVQLPDPAQGEPGPQPAPEFDAAKTYDKGYYVAVVNTKADGWGRCFNCGEEGHRWQQCTKLLKESLWQAKERLQCKNESLNRDGGARAKGGQPPPSGGYGPGQYRQGQQSINPQLIPSAF